MTRSALPGVSAETAAGLEVRARALEHGIDPDVRPADVATLATTAVPPNTGVLSVEEARRAQELVHDALSGLTPRIQVNMPSTEAVDLLRTSGRFRNVYDMIDAPEGERPQLVTDIGNAVDSRAFNERSHGFFGTGTTVYGTLHFGDETHVPQIDHSARTLRYQGRQLDVGATMYGDASVVLGDRAMRNATFLPRDTGLIGANHPLRTREHLDEVVTEYLVRNFEVAGPPEAGASTGTAFPGFRRPAAIADDFRAILRMPHERGVAALREHLTSEAINTPYMEAQVRVADAGDITAVHVERPPTTGIDPAVAEKIRGIQDEIRTLAEPRGVSVRYSDEPLPPRRDART